MGLKRTKLLGIQSVTGINTVGIFTAGVTPTAAGTAGTSYIRSVVMHNTGLSTATASLYIYPSGVAASGYAITQYRLGRVDIAKNDTYFYELNYPIVMTTQDKLVVEVSTPGPLTGGTGVGTAINFQVLGDTDI